MASTQDGAGNRYVYFDLPDLLPRDYTGAHLGEYDFAQKGFPVPFFAGTKARDPMTGQYKNHLSKLGFSDNTAVSMEFLNSTAFGLFKVEDEALARSIESSRKSGKAVGVMYRPDLRVRAFVFISDSSEGPFGYQVSGQVMKLQLRDPQGKVLVEF